MRKFEEVSDEIIRVNEMFDYLRPGNNPGTLGGNGYEEKSHMHLQHYYTSRTLLRGERSYKYFLEELFDVLVYGDVRDIPSFPTVQYVITFYNKRVYDVEIVEINNNIYLSPYSHMNNNQINLSDHWYEVLCEAYQDKIKEQKVLKR